MLDYQLSVARTTRAALALAPDSDGVPGTAIGSGTLAGVVSTLADRYDVYAMALAVGRPVTVQLVPLTPFGNYFPATGGISLLGPGATGIGQDSGHAVVDVRVATNDKDEAGRRTAVIQHTTAQTGVYYVLVEAGPFTQPYEGMDFAYLLSVGGNEPAPDVGGGFGDVAGSPYETAIDDLADRGIITGFPDNKFRPSDSVTRQQFAKMIVKARGFALTGSESCPFTDVVSQTGTDPFYPSKYVAVCAQQGITLGKTASIFDPDVSITHQQLITMVVRAADLPDPPEGFTPSFSPGQFSLHEHYLNARRTAYAGMLDGLQGVGPSYDFLAASTRGECAQLLYNMLRLD